MVLIVAGRQNGGSGDGYLLGVALALGAALMYAIAAAIVKQLAALPPQLIVLIQLTVGTLALAPFAGWLRRLRPHRLAAAGNPRPGAYRFDVHAAVWRHSEDPHGLVGALSFIYPAVAIVVDWAVFGHRLSLLQLLGSLAIPAPRRA